MHHTALHHVKGQMLIAYAIRLPFIPWSFAIGFESMIPPDCDSWFHSTNATLGGFHQGGKPVSSHIQLPDTHKTETLFKATLNPVHSPVRLLTSALCLPFIDRVTPLPFVE